MRMHVSLAVPDLEEAVSFYSKVFGTPPTLVKDDYAKWLLDDPKVNFVVEARGKSPGLDHLGIQAECESELAVLSGRMKAAGHAFVSVGETKCCYAKTDKAWTQGSTGERWEAFFTHHQNETDYGHDTDHLLDEISANPGVG